MCERIVIGVVIERVFSLEECNQKQTRIVISFLAVYLIQIFTNNIYYYFLFIPLKYFPFFKASPIRCDPVLPPFPFMFAFGSRF